MVTPQVFLASALIGLCTCIDLKFPPSFDFGSATAAYQIEGAWNVSDKGESLYDRFTHTYPNATVDGSNGDVACDSYNLWKRDIDMGVELGIKFYRFSISWPRLLPDGFTNRISEDGKNYYNNLIDGLLEKGIKPVVTLYHWDLPQNIQDLGGWTNPLTTDWFAEYARVVYSLYADRVKTWITINEPNTICEYAYGVGMIGPGIADTEIAVYLCNKHLLIAHAKAWRIYNNEFKPKYHGKVSISINLVWYQPYSPRDHDLTKLVTDFMVGRYTHPIYSRTGGWPPAIKEIMRKMSMKEGYQWSRLPQFTPDEIQLVKGTYDFFGLNHYTSRLVRQAKPGEEMQKFVTGIPELNAIIEVDPSWPVGDFSAMASYPEGLRKQLSWLKRTYGDIDILITENGYSTSTANSNLEDEKRITFIKSYLEQILLSVVIDGVKVVGYAYWSLMDNYEWSNGYTLKFGLYGVDFDSPLRTRTPRASAQYYKNVIKSRSLQVPPHLLNSTCS